MSVLVGGPFEVVGSRPSSVASQYNDDPPPQTPGSATRGYLKHVDKLFRNGYSTQDIESRIKKSKSAHKKTPAKGPVKATSKNNPSFVDETLFGGKATVVIDSPAPWEKPESTHRKVPVKSESPRPLSARKHTYKSKSKSSFVDETLFGSANKHLSTKWTSLEVDNAKVTPDQRAMSSRDLCVSGRQSSREERPPSRTNIGEGPIHGKPEERPRSRTGPNKRGFNPSYVDETLFGPKLQQPDFPAPWEKPEDRNKPRPYFCDSSNYTKVFEHDSQQLKRPTSSKSRPSSASKNNAARPAWR